MSETWDKKKGARVTACVECGSQDLAPQKRKCKACLAAIELARRARVYDRDRQAPCSVSGCGSLRYAMQSQVSSYCEAHHKAARKKVRLMASYGLTLEEYDALMARAGSACEICKGTVRLVVDHDHETGKVRGILCDDCNVCLGRLREDVGRLRAAAAYLESHG